MKQSNKEIKSDKHEIFTGFRKENVIEAKLLVGAAFKDENTAYYKIRLMMFPGYTYYLVKNHNVVDKYTVYARMIVDEKNRNQVKFLNPVGSATLDSKLQSYLEIRFPMLRATVYMSLYPQKQN
jgi:hypothetical protein